MNILRMQVLASFLNTLPTPKFRMANWLYDGNRQTSVRSTKEFAQCGTAACVGGWTVLIWGDGGNKRIDIRAREILGLTDDQAQYLFLGQWDKRNNLGTRFGSPKEAARAIRKMIKDEEARVAIASRA